MREDDITFCGVWIDYFLTTKSMPWNKQFESNDDILPMLAAPWRVLGRE